LRVLFGTYPASRLTGALAFIAASVSLARADTVDLAAASKQFTNSCGVCHTVDPGAEIRQGPNLRTAFGRKAGTLSEFPAFSEALKKAGAGGLTWSDETLDKWIAGAAEFVPGANMMYAQPDAEKRKLVIAYLKSLASAGATEAKP
jgi:cytochrome c